MTASCFLLLLGVMVITLNIIVIVWREIWAGKENFDGFLPKPSLDRARTAQAAGVSLLTGKLGASSGSRVRVPSRPPSIYWILVSQQSVLCLYSEEFCVSPASSAFSLGLAFWRLFWLGLVGFGSAVWFLYVGSDEFSPSADCFVWDSCFSCV